MALANIRVGNPLSEPGRWKLLKGDQGTSKVMVSCPGCGTAHVLDHDVAADGMVSPSLQCTECSWHANARLHRWDHGTLARADQRRKPPA